MARALLSLIWLCLVAVPLAGQTPDTTTGKSDIGLRLDLSVPPLRLEEPAALRAPWLGAPRLGPAGVRERWDSTLALARDSVRQERARAHRLLNIYGVAPEAEEPGAEPRRGVLGLSRRYADIEMDGQVRLEIRSDRLRNERCSAALLLDPNSGCTGGFNPPRLDNQVNLRSSGVLGRRVHLNIDYDSERDFVANNDVQVYYEGLEDEIVRRVEVGTVQFRPPPSRFITAAIPTSNFGVNAQFEVGRVTLQTLAATQKGSQVAERTYTVGQTTSQPQDRRVRDLDFETGRFFWIVNPSELPGFPELDILDLDPALVTPDRRPDQVRVYRYRAALNQSTSQTNLGGIRAVARSSDGNQSFGPVRWELLIQGTDYHLDASGLWLALGTKLDQNDFLAVSYITVDGTMVGSFPAQDRPTAGDSLRLIVEAKQDPTMVTFNHEMRQIYRVAGSDLDRSSLEVSLSVNQSERPLSGGSSTYLAALGLALPTDPNVFDRENRLFPRAQEPQAVSVVNESYVVYPHLRPFADATTLTDSERNDSLYQKPLYLLNQGPAAKFQLRLRYNSSGRGDRSTLSLGALQLREGTEQVTVAGRRLERDIDYTISYELGQITFLNPESLFGGGASQVSVRFEEQGIFAVAPTSIFGLSTSYSLGETGSVNLIGMYQREASAFNRPPLGFEATANLITGINTDLQFRSQGLTRLLNGLTSRPATAPSTLRINGEAALTAPDPNRSGQAYIEEFETEAGVPISLAENAWEFGSAPRDPAGVAEFGFAAGFELDDAVALTWQNLVPVPGTNQALEIRPESIDTLIRIAGRGERLETGMFMTLHADTAGGVVQRNNASRWSLPERPFRPRWRSMVTPLSSTGIDLTRNEFLEFWVFHPASRTADSAGVLLVLDLGKVDEDAVGIAPESLSVAGPDSVFTGRQLVGLGELDSERSSLDIFNAETDDVGILGDRPPTLTTPSGEVITDLELCQRILSTTVPVFPWGDLSGRCTNGNGVLDTEDLDSDNVLNARGESEDVFRYVVQLRRDGKYFVRTGVQTTDDQGRVAGWELYRIPIRSPDATIGTPNLRVIQHLRLTVAAPPDQGGPDPVARFALARMRLVGSSWTRRAERPIAGLAGAIANPSGEIVASVVSTENRIDLGYESPPGVAELVQRRDGDQQSLGTQINEKSLRLIAEGLEVGDRAEAYLRFPVAPQNALSYREMRVWMRGRGPGWEEGDLQAFVKVGSDDRNFYMYRAPARSTTWEPEFVVDLEVWRRLRAESEAQRLRGPPVVDPACGVTDPNVYVVCEGPYLVYTADPGVNPPNLAAIQEISAGIYRANASVTLTEAELWVDDIRLSNPVSQLGTAVSLDAQLVASDVGNVRLSYVQQNGQFRQINEDPSYRGTGALQLNTGWQLDRFLPASLGLSMPLTVNYSRADVSPELLTGTDLRGDALPGLRRPSSSTQNYTLAVRRNRKGTDFLTRALADPLSLRASLVKGRTQSEFASASSDAYSLSASYNLQMGRRGFGLPFGGLVGALPRWLAESEGGKGVRNARFNLLPSSVRLSSGLSRNQAEQFSFGAPIARAVDSLVRPTFSLNHLWQNAAGMTWQPLGMLSLNTDLTSTRDLRVYPDSSTLGRLAYAERKFLLGIPVGVERDRNLTTSLALTPVLSSWLRPRFTTSSGFILSRTLNTRVPVREFEDSGAYILPQTLNNRRTRELGLAVDLGRAFQQLFGDSGGIGGALGRIRPLDVSSQLTRSSTFDLAAFDPSLKYQLGLGGRGSFLFQEGASAVNASEVRTATLSSGADLPFGFSGTLSYSLTRTEQFRRVGEAFAETVLRQREWPAATVRWNRIFTKGPITTVNASFGVRRREGTSVQLNREAGGIGATSATLSSSLTPDVQITLRNGMNFAAGLSSRTQRTENNGNATVLDQDDVTGSFSYSFRLPESISRSRKLIRSSVTLFASTSQTCLRTPTEPECAILSDLRRREVRGGLDTDLMQILTGGFQFGYSINEVRHLDGRTSQIFLQLSLQLSLFSGDYR
ncbi:MAG TPA: cell surface protein SprA [Gemmatimonadales bacterium]|nr:cell surface protein SprA [Gemmatimonadales bacterium]